MFFFMQKTAYEMRISDWSSDVCSSDLLAVESQAGHDGEHDGHGDTEPEARVDIERILSVLTSEQRAAATANDPVLVLAGAGTGKTRALKDGRAAGRERGCEAA